MLFVGRNTLLYLLFQHQALVLIQHFRERVWGLERSYVMSAIIPFVVLLLLVVPIMLTNRYIPILSGKYRPIKG